MTDSRPALDSAAALIVIDAQEGFSDGGAWRQPNNPHFEANTARLIAAWRDSDAPVVVVRHDSVEPGSTLRPGQPGNALVGAAASLEPHLLVVKSVESSFLGTPDLAEWLRARGIRQILLSGIATNTCVETTARMGSNLGFDVLVAIDATRAFALTGADGTTLSADELTAATAVNLTASGFARIVSTDDAVRALESASPSLQRDPLPSRATPAAVHHFEERLRFETDPSDVATARARGEKLVIVDVRSRESWDQGHLPGALHIPSAELADRLGELPPPDEDPAIITYCWGPGCNGSTKAALTLARAGYGNVREMIGGFEYWAREGLRYESAAGSGRRPVDPLTAPIG